jgi:hypothetical protein
MAQSTTVYKNEQQLHTFDAQPTTIELNDGVYASMTLCSSVREKERGSERGRNREECGCGGVVSNKKDRERENVQCEGV